MSDQHPRDDQAQPDPTQQDPTQDPAPQGQPPQYGQGPHDQGWSHGQAPYGQPLQYGQAPYPQGAYDPPTVQQDYQGQQQYQGQPYQAGYGQQPYPPQQYPGQPYPPQQYPGQPYPPQQYPGQQYPGQPYAGQPYAGQPYPGQPYPQPYGSPYPSAPAQQGEASAPEGNQRLGFVALVIVGVSLLVVTVAGYVVGGAVGQLVVQIGLEASDQLSPSDPRMIAVAEQVQPWMSAATLATFAGIAGWVTGILAYSRRQGRRFALWSIILGLAAPILAIIAMVLGMLPAIQAMS